MVSVRPYKYIQGGEVGDFPQDWATSAGPPSSLASSERNIYTEKSHVLCHIEAGQFKVDVNLSVGKPLLLAVPAATGHPQQNLLVIAFVHLYYFVKI